MMILSAQGDDFYVESSILVQGALRRSAGNDSHAVTASADLGPSRNFTFNCTCRSGAAAAAEAEAVESSIWDHIQAMQKQMSDAFRGMFDGLPSWMQF